MQINVIFVILSSFKMFSLYFQPIIRQDVSTCKYFTNHTSFKCSTQLHVYVCHSPMYIMTTNECESDKITQEIL